ncbi:hypothetical protein [Salaquimonas pukyongi]|uniref:hypothetical protein n=1 Tax=Salaquimonas pukyongi TaxID=2712698 RepID=UPI00096B9871|nr:hypothetical protein [Salaquimonas pukyongi]
MPTAEVAASTKPFEIDLRGLSPEKVVEELTAAEFSEVNAHDTDVYTWESVCCAEPFSDRVVCVSIKDEEADRLTVTVFDGTKHTLRAGQDLYWFDKKEGGWGYARTSYFYR